MRHDFISINKFAETNTWFQQSELNFFVISPTGKKFGFDATNAAVVSEGGAEIDSIEVIRDNDKIFFIEDHSSVMKCQIISYNNT